MKCREQQNCAAHNSRANGNLLCFLAMRPTAYPPICVRDARVQKFPPPVGTIFCDGPPLNLCVRHDLGGGAKIAPLWAALIAVITKRKAGVIHHSSDLFLPLSLARFHELARWTHRAFFKSFNNVGYDAVPLWDAKNQRTWLAVLTLWLGPSSQGSQIGVTDRIREKETKACRSQKGQPFSTNH